MQSFLKSFAQLCIKYFYQIQKKKKSYDYK